MHFKLFLLFAFIFGGVNLHAQYVPQTWGSGVAMGSNQMQCAHEYKTAEMITAGNKQVKADKKELSRLKKERRNLKRDVTKLKRDMARNKRALNNNFKRNISNLLMDHLEEGRGPSSYKSCSATNSKCKPINSESIAYDSTSRRVVDDSSVVESGPSEQELRRRLEKCLSEKNDEDLCQREYYNSQRSSTARSERTVTETTTKYTQIYTVDQRSSSNDQVSQFNSVLQSILNNGSDSNTVGNYDTPSEMCIPAPDETNSDSLAMLYEQDGSTCLNVLKGFSNSDGTLNTGICNVNVPIHNSSRDAGECRKAIEEMNSLSSELQAKMMDLETLDYAIEDAEDALRALEDDVFDELVAEGKILEVECENCEQPVYREKPSMWSNVSQLLGLGLGAAAAYYTADKVSDKNARLGWPTNPYLGVQVGFPFVMAGIYGGILGGQSHGGYGCAGGVGGAGGGAFGYPPGMFGVPFRVRIYMPGMGPWGMPGPWSDWGQMGGGFIGGLAAMGGVY
ncbi:MAG: hypothetical protein MK008_09145, partial [Bdellovibrionales bacterium]|nr:hypothetical protein [Bdellovibrionales bacterium]